MGRPDPRRDRGTVRLWTVLTVAALVAVALMIAFAAAAVLSSDERPGAGDQPAATTVPPATATATATGPTFPWGLANTGRHVLIVDHTRRSES